MNADTIGIPLAWLVGALWLLTTTLAGALGTALYKKLDAMETALERIAQTSQDLSESHARLEARTDARVEALDHRVASLERADERRMQ